MSVYDAFPSVQSKVNASYTDTGESWGRGEIQIAIRPVVVYDFLRMVVSELFCATFNIQHLY